MAMTTTIVMRETEAGVRVDWHQDAMPAYRSETYPDRQTAEAAHPAARWTAPDADADGDVLAVSEL